MSHFLQYNYLGKCRSLFYAYLWIFIRKKSKFNVICFGVYYFDSGTFVFSTKPEKLFYQNDQRKSSLKSDNVKSFFNTLVSVIDWLWKYLQRSHCLFTCYFFLRLKFVVFIVLYIQTLLVLNRYIQCLISSMQTHYRIKLALSTFKKRLKINKR